MEEQELTIAVIDDDPGDTELLRQYLEDIREWDVDLLTYEDSGSARSGLAGRAVDAIFVDYLLGAETGLEVLEQLLSLNITAPIIMLTGQGSEEVAVQALKAGAADYMTKGTLSGDSLKRAIANAIEKRELRCSLEDHRKNLERSNKDLVKKNEEIRNFYHTLSHELKTPLTSAMEFLSITMESLAGPISKEQEEYLEIAKESCKQIWSHINDLLDVTRLETGKSPLKLHFAHIEALVQRVLNSMSFRARDLGIDLQCNLDPTLDEVLIDEGRIFQVLANLIDNAVKFTPEGGRIGIFAKRHPEKPEFIQVSVSDTGRGIPKDKLECIFDRLYQASTKEEYTEGGLGLGLYLCRELIRYHGGEITVESEPGEGSTFSFTLPRGCLIMGGA